MPLLFVRFSAKFNQCVLRFALRKHIMGLVIFKPRRNGMSNFNFLDVQLVELFRECLVYHCLVADRAFYQVGLDAHNVDAQARRNL